MMGESEWLGQRRVKSHFRLGFEGVFEEMRFEPRPKCKGGICPEKTREAERTCMEDQSRNKLGKMANGHVERYSASVIIRDMQIKATLRYRLTRIRMTIIKKIYKQ